MSNWNGCSGLPPLIHELIEKVPLHVEDYPSDVRAEVFVFQFLQRMHQRFRHEPSAVGTKVALGVGHFAAGFFAHIRVVTFAQRKESRKGNPAAT